jgi:hypothetical protein
MCQILTVYSVYFNLFIKAFNNFLRHTVTIHINCIIITEIFVLSMGHLQR